MPQRKFTIETTLSIGETQVRLRDLILTRTSIIPTAITDDNSPFYGEFHNQHFYAYQLAYRDSFNPRIEGTIAEIETGTKLELRMELPTEVRRLLRFGYYVAISLMVIFFLASIVSGLISWVLVPIGMLFYGRWFYQVGFASFHQKALAHYTRFASTLNVLRGEAGTN